MSLSTALSKLSRLTLLSLFCAGLFVSVGDLRVGSGGVEIGGSGVNVVAAKDGADAMEKSLAESSKPTPEMEAEWASIAAGTGNKQQPLNAAIDGLIDIYNMGIELLSIFITPLIMLAGWLLSPDWTFGDIFGLEPILKQLWILISNVVYVIFGFMLVGIAFANIFGVGGAEYEMKKMLPKLVMGMLMVPFTWFIVSATLSVANILTASVIQLPVDTIHKASSAKIKEFFDEEKVIPKKITVDLTGSGVGGTGKEQMDCSDKTKDKCISISTLLSDPNGGAYNLLTAYAYGIFSIDKYKDIKKTQLDKKMIKTTGDLLRKVSFGIIFYIVFSILVIAIVYALFTRAIMLWMFAIFSPLFALNFVLGGSKSKALEKLGKFDIKHFISLAMVPVYVSAALSFGLMFLSLVMNPPTTDGVGKTTSVDGTQTFSMGPITLTTIGDPNMAATLGTGFQTGQGILSTVILGFLALVVLWMAVMAALGADEITGHAVEPIASLGKSVGELAVKAPSYIPLKLPGMDKGVSMHGMQTIGANIKNNFEAQSQRSGQEFSDKFFGKNELTNAARELTTKINGPWSKETIDGLQRVLKQGGDAKTLSENGGTREMVAAVAGKLDIKNIGDLTNQAQMAKILGDIDHKLEAEKPVIAPEGILPGRRGNILVTPDILKESIAKISAGTPATTVPVAGTSTATIGAKVSGTEKIINVKNATTQENIILHAETVLSKTTIDLKGNDKAELAEIIKGKTPAEAKTLLETIFNKDQIDIDKLYNAIK